MPFPLLLQLASGPAGGPPLPVGFCGVSDAQGVGDPPSITWSHTHSGDCDQLLVWVDHYDQFVGVTSITYNGVALTEIDHVHNVGAYLLQSPPVGTFDIVVVISPPRRCIVAAYSLSGFDFSTAVITQNANLNAAPTHTVASAVGEYVFDYTRAEPLDGNPLSWTVGAGQTELFSQETLSNVNLAAAGSYQDGAASVVMSWTLASSAFWRVSVLSGVEGVTPPDGGGDPDPGVNPSLGIVPENPLTFIHIRTVTDDDYYFAVPQLNDDDDWHGGKKPGKLIAVSDITRRLGKNGSFEGTRVTARIEDTDRQFRTLVATDSLRGSYFAVYWIDDEDRRAKLEPFRIFAGRLTDHRGLPGFVYEFTAHDALATRLAAISQQPTIPPDRLTSVVFPSLDPAIEGQAAPIVVGLVSDQTTNVQGVVPAKYLGGPLNLNTLGGPNHLVDVYIWTKGALPNLGVWNVYYNDPATPTVRVVVPGSAWGAVVWTPYKPGWFAATQYIDHNGERYTPFFVSRTLGDLADAVKDGRTLVAANIFGMEEIGDGSGSYMSSPARIWQWILVNWVFNRYKTGTYFPVPDLDGVYSVIDTDTVVAAELEHHARLTGGYTAGFILGRDGNAQSVFDVLGELCQGTDMEMGINRHGQLILKVENNLAAAEMTYDAYQVEDGTYETWIEPQELINRVEHEYGYLYTPPFAPAPTPAEGEPVPTKPMKDVPKWESGMVVTEDTAAQAQIGGEISTLKLQNFAVRDPATATDVALQLLNRGLGPTNEGPRWYAIRGGPWLLGENGSPATILDLGSVFAVSHPERVGTDITTVDRCRILEVTYHPLKKRVTYKGRVLTGLSLVVEP